MSTKKEAKTIEAVCHAQRVRVNVIKTMNGARNRCVATIASNIGYHSFQEESDRKKLYGKAMKVFKIIDPDLSEKDQIESITEILKDKKAAEQLSEYLPVICYAQEYLATLGLSRDATEKHMIELIRQLPICEWWVAEKGRAEKGLAVIIGEAGDISNYENPAKLWKRFGVAVLNGVRQGGLKKGSPAEKWIEHGYCKRRRSALWTIGDSLLKNNGRNGNTGKYKILYNKRKIFEVERLKKQWIAEGNKEKDFKLMTSHRRAQRYVEKRLLRDLWNQWHGKFN